MRQEESNERVAGGGVNIERGSDGAEVGRRKVESV
jgi:hypothetical protein